MEPLLTGNQLGRITQVFLYGTTLETNMKLAMGVLCYSRPIHTALTLAYAFANKADTTDLHFFYGVPRSASHPSPCLQRMLTELNAQGYGSLHYLPEDSERNTGGNVDNLMTTMGALTGYDCFFKIDDDVLIGPGTDDELAELLLAPELQASKVYILTGQAVREHMRGPRSFCWDIKLNNRTIVSRSRGLSPMETFAAVSYKMMPHLIAHGLKDTCENTSGTFGPYSQKLWNTQAKAALVLFPHIVMQHIGLTCTTGLREDGAPRSWAPARCWSPAGRVIDVPHFDFREWENSHNASTQDEAGLTALARLQEHTNHPAIDIIISELKAYTPGVGDVALPIGRPVEDERLVRRKRRKRRVSIVGALT